jgi:protein ImuB
MTVAEARGRCPGLDVRPWDQHAIDDAILAVTTALLDASPQVTPAAGAPGLWWVGAGGFAALGGEPALAAALLAIAHRWHPDARVAIADSCVAARAATWAPRPRSNSPRPNTHVPPTHIPGITIVPAGGCAAYLAPAPLGLVPMDGELQDALHALGLRTVGALAELEPADIERRWGAAGLAAWRLAHGDDPRRPGLVRVEAARSAGVELPAPADGAAPVLFVLRALLERLVRELVDDGRAAAAVSVTLVLDAGRYGELQRELQPKTGGLGTRDSRPGTGSEGDMGVLTDGRAEATGRTTPRDLLAVPYRTVTREVRPARPIARLEPLFDQCRTLLERWTLPAPVIGVTIGIPATAPLAADQGDLLVPSWRDAAMTAETVFTRLRTALDPDGTGDVVVTPAAGDAHRPEHRARWTPADALAIATPTHHPPPTTSTPSGDAPHPLPEPVSSLPSPVPSLPVFSAPAPAALRLLTPPEPVDVECTAGLPDAVWWRGRRLALVHADGPERLSGDWWRPDAFARDYWRCATGAEGTLLLYREAGGWHLQGWYD